MMRARQVLMGVLMASVLAAAPVVAQQAKKPARKMKAGLQLTDEQKAKISDLKLAMQKEIAPLKAKLQSLRTDVKLLMTSDSPDLGKIEAKQREIADVQTKLAMARIRHTLEVRKLLTPEQRKKFDANILSGKKARAKRRAAARMHRMRRMRPGARGPQPR